MLPHFPKPKDVKRPKDWIKIFLDGREVLNCKTAQGREEYKRRKRVMYERQNKRCFLVITPQCKEKKGRWAFDLMQFDHWFGRTAGKQDDRIEKADETGTIKPINCLLCPWCNSYKGSRPITDFPVDDFVP
jgi:hypothetical protein